MKTKLLRIRRRSVSVLLSLLMVVSLFTIVPFTAGAEETVPQTESASEITAESAPETESTEPTEAATKPAEAATKPTEAAKKAAEPAKKPAPKKAKASTGDGETTYYYVGSATDWDFDAANAFTKLTNDIYYKQVSGTGTFKITNAMNFNTAWGADNNNINNSLGDTGGNLADDGTNDHNVSDTNSGTHYIMFSPTYNKIWAVAHDPSLASRSFYKDYAATVMTGTGIVGRYGHVYFNAYSTGWNAQTIYFVVGNATYIKAYKMSHIGDSTWYELNRLNDTTNGFDDARYYAFVNASTDLSTDYTSSSIQRGYLWLINDSCVVNYSNIFDPATDSVAINDYNNTYTFGADTSGNLCDITGEYMDYAQGTGKPFTISGTTLTAYSGTYKNVVIPSSVTTIDDGVGDTSGVFLRNNSLKSVFIPDNVTVIGDYTFSNTDNLLDVRLPVSISSMGHSIFCSGHNVKLESCNLPDDLTFVPQYMFQH